MNTNQCSIKSHEINKWKRRSIDKLSLLQFLLVLEPSAHFHCENVSILEVARLFGDRQSLFVLTARASAIALNSHKNSFFFLFLRRITLYFISRDPSVHFFFLCFVRSKLGSAFQRSLNRDHVQRSSVYIQWIMLSTHPATFAVPTNYASQECWTPPAVGFEGGHQRAIFLTNTRCIVPGLVMIEPLWMPTKPRLLIPRSPLDLLV